MAFRSERFDQACIVTVVSRCHAVADHLPSVRSVLGTAARTEQIVVQFIITSRVRPVEDCHGGAFESDDDCLVRGVCVYVPSESIEFPAKVLCVVEATFDVLPLSSPRFCHVCIGCHLGKCNDGCLVRVIRSLDLIYGPRRCRKGHGFTVDPCIIQYTIDRRPPSIRKTLDVC